MKIAVCICSRGHPAALVGVVMALHRLASGKHEVAYFAGMDVDDMTADSAADILRDTGEGADVRTYLWERPPARGAIENRLLSLEPVRLADAVTFMSDRTFPVSTGWDEGVAAGAAEQPKRVLWWSCPQDNGCVIPIIPKAWMEACDWKWSPEIFPFWFDDTWNQQIDLLIHGLPSLKNRAAVYAGARGKTTRARDMAFWIELFHRLLPSRVTQAREMEAKFALPWQERHDVIQYFNAWYKAMSEGAARMEREFGDQRDPGPEYFIAKEKAEKLMSELVAVDLGAVA